MIDLILNKVISEIFSSPETVSELKLGDIIYVDRGLYKHFGVYSGNDKVIHYTKDEGGCLDGTIRETSLKKFLEDANKCFVCNFDKKGHRESVSLFNAQGVVAPPLDCRTWKKEMNRKSYSPEETVERARSCIGKKGYSLICNNCEHFAIWCKTGIKESSQVDELLSIIDTIDIAKIPGAVY